MRLAGDVGLGIVTAKSRPLFIGFIVFRVLVVPVPVALDALGFDSRNGRFRRGQRVKQAALDVLRANPFNVGHPVGELALELRHCALAGGDGRDDAGNQ